MNPSNCVASALQPLHRQDLAIEVLAKKEKISHLAAREGVSRKFLYQQRNLAQQALAKKAQGATTQRSKLEQKMESAKLGV